MILGLDGNKQRDRFYCNTIGRKCKWNKDSKCQKAINRHRHCVAINDLKKMRF